MQSSNHFGSSDASDDDDEEDAGSGWLTHSTFRADGLSSASSVPASSQRRPLSANGFDVSVATQPFPVY